MFLFNPYKFTFQLSMWLKQILIHSELKTVKPFYLLNLFSLKTFRNGQQNWIQHCVVVSTLGCHSEWSRFRSHTDPDAHYLFFLFLPYINSIIDHKKSYIKIKFMFPNSPKWDLKLGRWRTNCYLNLYQCLRPLSHPNWILKTTC